MGRSDCFYFTDSPFPTSACRSRVGHVRINVHRDTGHGWADGSDHDVEDGEDLVDEEWEAAGGSSSTASSQRSYRSHRIMPPPRHAVTGTASDLPSSHGDIYFTFQECDRDESTTKPRAVPNSHSSLAPIAVLSHRSSRDSYAMDDYRSSSLFQHGNSSYAPSSSSPAAYFNPSPVPSSPFDLDGRVVFKRQRVREDSPESSPVERTQDIWDWVRGVDERRRQMNGDNTPNSFSEEYVYGSTSEHTTTDPSYLRPSASPYQTSEPRGTSSISPMLCPLSGSMNKNGDYREDDEDDSPYTYPSRCSSTTLEHAGTVPPRPAALNDPGMQSFLSWLAEDDETSSKYKQAPLPPARFQVSPLVDAAADYRCYDDDCLCSSCISIRATSSGFRPAPLQLGNMDFREVPVTSSSYPVELDDANMEEMWSPPSLLSSSSSPPFRQSPLSPAEQSCSPSDIRSIWDEDEPSRSNRSHYNSNNAYSPDYLSFSPFSGWNTELPETSALHSKTATLSLDTPSSSSSSSFSNIPLHQPQPVRPIILIHAPLLDSGVGVDQTMDDDMIGGFESAEATATDAASVKLSIRSSKSMKTKSHHRRRKQRNSTTQTHMHLITSIA